MTGTVAWLLALSGAGQHTDEEIEKERQARIAKDEELSLAILQRALISETGNKLKLVMDSETYQLHAELYDKNDNLIYTSDVIDLPIEETIINIEFDAKTNELIFTLRNGTKLRVPIGAIISGLASLSWVTEHFADKTDTLNHIQNENIHVSLEAKEAWNAKYDKPETGIPEDHLSSDVKEKLNRIQDVQNANGDSYVNDENIAVVDVSNLAYNHPQYTTVKAALDKLLYVTPVINSFTGGGTYENGSSISTITFKWTINKDVLTLNINQGVGDIDATLRTHTYTPATPITSNKTFTLTVNDGTTTVTKTTSVSFVNSRYWGVSAKATLEDSDIIALNHELNANRAQTRTFDCTGSKYFYLVIPTASCTGIKFKVGGLAFSDMNCVTRDVVNASGKSISYNIYRPNNIQTGSEISVEVS